MMNIVVDPDTSAGSGGRLKGELVLKTRVPAPVDINNVVEGEITVPGEYEISGVRIKGVMLPSDGDELKTAFRVVVDDLALGFLGNASSELSEKVLESLGEIDVLFIPSNDISGKLVKAVAPKVAVPGWGDPARAMADIGQKPEPQDKIVIKKKDLESEEGFRLIVLKQ
jgi:hypothetical protein